MPRRPVRRESNVGLIVTLIFFILTSVGLGVATYYGFSQQDQLTKAAKENKDAYDDMKAKQDWYEFQALLYRAWLGQTAGFDQPVDASGTKAEEQLQTLRKSYEEGSLGKDGKKQDLPDKAIVTDMITKVEGNDYLVLMAMKDGKPVPPAAQTPPVLVNMKWDTKQEAAEDDLRGDLLGAAHDPGPDGRGDRGGEDAGSEGAGGQDERHERGRLEGQIRQGRRRPGRVQIGLRQEGGRPERRSAEAAAGGGDDADRPGEGGRGQRQERTRSGPGAARRRRRRRRPGSTI